MFETTTKDMKIMPKNTTSPVQFQFQFVPPKNKHLRIPSIRSTLEIGDSTGDSTRGNGDSNCVSGTEATYCIPIKTEKLITIMHSRTRAGKWCDVIFQEFVRKRTGNLRNWYPRSPYSKGVTFSKPLFFLYLCTIWGGPKMKLSFPACWLIADF